MLEFITFFTLFISIGFLLTIIFQGKRTRSMYAFIFLLAAFIGWTISNYFSLINTDIPTITFWMRVVMCVTTYLLLGILELGNYFPESNSFFLKEQFGFLEFIM